MFRQIFYNFCKLDKHRGTTNIKFILPVQGIEPRFLGRPARSLVTPRVLTTLCRLLTVGDQYKSQPPSKYWILFYVKSNKGRIFQM
jgi:hypothetical protein